MKKIIFPVLASFALIACGSVLPKGKPAPALYTLNAPVVSAKEQKKIPVSLQVLMPQAAPGLETERVAIRKDDNQIDYFKDVRWSGTVTALVQSLLVQSFDHTRSLNSVSNDLVAVKDDYSLMVEIHDFQAQYKGSTPYASIRMTSKLIEKKDSHIVTTSTYNENETAKADNLREIIAAFDRAYQRISTKIVQDTLKTLEKQKRI